ncbi:hypothetical protein LPC08_22170 [Roseomonas sp. OT10]|uniref:hypothetical protein n=1 Tax=Roseomonas cutis TaxID=2897332 RepID=UPI001E6266CA|nr:hypothetical protein [Roseomonas sp. OT10]UFN48685.1 hypothetical protein LPC08_22170 [Roseomonas sp. OT10]
MRAPVTALLALGLAALPPGARAQPALEEVGSWLTGCSTDRMTDRAECRMLHRQPVEPASAGQAALTLEVMERSGTLVPVVAARDLTLEGAARGLLAFTGTAQLRFPPNRLFEMPCALEGRSVVCAPKAEDAARAAAELAAADRALVRMTGLLPGEQARAEPVELRLSRTGDALSRLRARLPQGVATPPPAPGFDLRDLLGRLLRFFQE